MIDYLLFLLYKFFKVIFLLMPHRFVKKILDGLSYIVYLLNAEHKRYAMINLDLVYGETISYGEKKRIIRESYRNIFYNIYEFIENPTLTLEELEKKISLENEEFLLKAIKDNRKIILVSAHYGNWEYITSYISLKYKPTTMVGRHMNNHYLNEELESNRNKHKSQMLLKANSAKGLMKALKEGRIIGLATDQHIDPKKGVIIDFLGQKASQVDSSARLALKFDAVIIPVFFIQNSFRNYTVKFYEPIDVRDYQEDEHKEQHITQKEADAMSRQILLKPENWFWQHRRFKEFHNNLYKEIN